MKIFYTIFFIATSLIVRAQSDGIRIKHFNINRSIALQGYDPVSYHEGKPEEGIEKNKYTFKGITYFFVNASNLSQFKANPDKYEPVYGGWCAYAMGENGEKVKVDPGRIK